jgi:hypothetical protein
MEFDLQRAAVVAGDGIVARFAGVFCVARCADPEPLRTLLELCAAAAGDDPGLALSRSLAKWLAATDDLAGELAFGTIAQAGEQLAVFLNGAVAVEIVAERQRLSGTDAAAWTDRLLPLPDSPVVLALHDAMSTGATMTHLGLLDLQRGVVPGAGVVVRAERGDAGWNESGRPAPARPAPQAPSDHLERSPLAPDVDRASQGMPPGMPTGNGRPSPVLGPLLGSAPEPAPLRAGAEPARPSRVGRDRKLAAVPEPGAPFGVPYDGRSDGSGEDTSRADDWFQPEPAAEPDAAARFGAEFSPEYQPELESEFPADPSDPLSSAWVEPGTRHPGRHSVYDDNRGDHDPTGQAPQPAGPPQPLAPERLVNGSLAASADEVPTPSRGDAAVAVAHQTDVDEREHGSGQAVPAPRLAPRAPRAETLVGLQPTEEAPVAEAFPGTGTEAPEAPASLGLLRWDDGATYTLDAGYLVGRMPESDERVRNGELRSIVVEDRSGAVSRVHAEIRLDGPDVLLIDSGSRNGTFVAAPGQPGWTPITPGQTQRLGAGTRVRMGGRTFVYEPAEN